MRIGKPFKRKSKKKNLSILRKDLRQKANPRKATVLKNFFKTGPGQYGEGDVFLGVTVPELRILTKIYRYFSLADLRRLLQSPVHEERLLGLLILVEQYKKGALQAKEKIFRFYLKNLRSVNNWDLVDLTAPQLVGRHLSGKRKTLLYQLVRSKNLWERRISIVATFFFIRDKQFKDTFQITRLLLKDPHDLIHKATGWMLREIGKRDQKAQELFLKRHYKQMPRTMLRYAIERFPYSKRMAYLKSMI